MKTDARIGLGRGFFTLVDGDEIPNLRRYRWRIDFSGITAYAVMVPNREYPDGITMHRLLLGVHEGRNADHINGNGLDNRRANLRLVTPFQNAVNKGKTTSPTTSRFKGVYASPEDGGWRAKIQIHGQQRHLGTFSDEVSAARAYDAAANELFAEFARTNETLGLYDSAEPSPRFFRSKVNRRARFSNNLSKNDEWLARQIQNFEDRRGRPAVRQDHSHASRQGHHQHSRTGNGRSQAIAAHCVNSSALPPLATCRRDAMEAGTHGNRQ